MPANSVLHFQTNCIKVFLYIFNTTQLVSGVSVLALCIYIKYGIHLDEFGGSGFQLVIYGSITISLWVSVMGIVGCVATKSEKPCILLWYFAVLAILMLSELAVGVIMVANREKLTQTIKSTLSGMIRDVDSNEDSANAPLIDWLQNRFECCGADGPDDWENTPPQSCYCYYCDNRLTIDVYSQGCIDALSNKARLFVVVIYTMILIMGVIQLLGLMYSMKLIRHLRKQKHLEDLQATLVNNNLKRMTTSL